MGRQKLVRYPQELLRRRHEQGMSQDSLFHMLIEAINRSECKEFTSQHAYAYVVWRGYKRRIHLPDNVIGPNGI